MYLKPIPNLFLILLLIPLFNNCQDKSSVESEVQSYNLEPLWVSKGSVSLSEIAESIDYMKLERTDDPGSLVSSPNRTQILATENYFFVFRRDSKLSVFSKNGQFLRTIGNIGKGPGEYTKVGEVMISEDEENVWLLDRIVHKLINYSIEGELVKEVKINDKGSRAILCGKQIYLLCLEYSYEQQEASHIEIIDLEGKVLSQIPLYVGRRSGPGGIILRQNLAFMNDHLQHFEPPYDTAFSLSDEGNWNPLFVFHAGPNKIPFEAYSERKFNDVFQPHSFISDLIETPHFFFLEGIHKQRRKMILADKDKEWVRNCDFVPNKVDQAWRFYGLENDIDGGLPFWPKCSFKDKSVYSLLDPINMIEFMEAISDVEDIDPVHRRKLDELLANLDEEDNPIVMKVNLK